MRLICPNCDAQYEVPDDVMPVAGRDVQCSNC
ncbi:zinc-ribbon domain-containing protein, partial [Sulfitobacter sp.]|nr:zinc-ribbon domain-containing protein [Sulfitobacter sp.]